jgi:hypothetical protein
MTSRLHRGAAAREEGSCVFNRVGAAETVSVLVHRSEQREELGVDTLLC